MAQAYIVHFPCSTPYQLMHYNAIAIDIEQAVAMLAERGVSVDENWRAMPRDTAVWTLRRAARRLIDDRSPRQISSDSSRMLKRIKKFRGEQEWANVKNDLDAQKLKGADRDAYLRQLCETFDIDGDDLHLPLPQTKTAAMQMYSQAWADVWSLR